MEYYANSITLGGGESMDLILDTCLNRVVFDSCTGTNATTGVAATPIPTGTYYLYTPTSGSPVERRGELRRNDDRSSRLLGGAAMSATTIKEVISMKRLLSLAAAAALTWAAGRRPRRRASPARPVRRHVQPGCDGTRYINQPDGNQVYSWGYGCILGERDRVADIRTGGVDGHAGDDVGAPGPTLLDDADAGARRWWSPKGRRSPSR